MNRLSSKRYALEEIGEGFQIVDNQMSEDYRVLEVGDEATVTPIFNNLVIMDHLDKNLLEEEAVAFVDEVLSLLK